MQSLVGARDEVWFVICLQVWPDGRAPKESSQPELWSFHPCMHKAELPCTSQLGQSEPRQRPHGLHRQGDERPDREGANEVRMVIGHADMLESSGAGKVRAASTLT